MGAVLRVNEDGILKQFLNVNLEGGCWLLEEKKKKKKSSSRRLWVRTVFACSYRYTERPVVRTIFSSNVR